MRLLTNTSHPKRFAPLCALGLVLAACGPAIPQAGGAGPAEAPRPKVLTVAVREIEGSLGDGLGISIPNYDFIRAGLAYHDESDIARPLLAEHLPSQDDGTWSISSDGTMRTVYRLKPDLRWQDGTPLTAADYVFQRMVAADPDLPLRRGVIDRLISDVGSPDDQTLEIRWSGPYLEASQLTTDPLPRHLLAELYGRDKQAFLGSSFWTTPDYVSAGPYRIIAFEPGAEITLAANPHFALGKPRIDTVIVKIIPDVNTIVANMMASAIDFVANKHIKAPEAAALRDYWAGSGDGSILTMELGQRYLEFQRRAVPSHQEAVTDLRVRQALMHAIDRETLGQTAMAGLAGAADSGYSRQHPFFATIEPSLTKYSYDPRRSEQLLATAGWIRSPEGGYRSGTGPGLDLDLWAITDFEPSVIAADWRRAGLNASVNVLPRALVEDAEYRATFPSVTLSTGVDANPYARIISANVPSAANRFRGSNRGSYVNPEIDRLFDLTQASFNLDQRKRTQAELEAIATADVAIGMLFYEVQPAAALKRMQGVKPRQRAGFAWNVWEWDVTR